MANSGQTNLTTYSEHRVLADSGKTSALAKEHLSNMLALHGDIDYTEVVKVVPTEEGFTVVESEAIVMKDTLHE